MMRSGGTTSHLDEGFSEDIRSLSDSDMVYTPAGDGQMDSADTRVHDIIQLILDLSSGKRKCMCSKHIDRGGCFRPVLIDIP